MTNLLYKPHQAGHRERLRERFERAGSDGLQDYELLELLLTYSIFRKDVKPAAKQLLERFGSLAGVLDAGAVELRNVEDIGPASATLIQLVKQMCGVYLAERLKRRDVLTSPERVADFATMTLAGLPHEAFMVIYVNTQNEYLAHEILQEGTIDQVAVYPRRIIERALAHHSAAMLLAHNHPSGHTYPSHEDRQLTSAIADAARLLGLRVLDHLVVGRGSFLSFLAQGLMPGSPGGADV